MEKIVLLLAKELNIKPAQAEAALQLLDDGNTVPFIARYRKEATGSLDEEQIRNVETRAQYLRNLDARREEILNSIREQEKLTPELEQQIMAAACPTGPKRGPGRRLPGKKDWNRWPVILYCRQIRRKA